MSFLCFSSAPNALKHFPSFLLDVDPVSRELYSYLKLKGKKQIVIIKCLNLSTFYITKYQTQEAEPIY